VVVVVINNVKKQRTTGSNYTYRCPTTEQNHLNTMLINTISNDDDVKLNKNWSINLKLLAGQTLQWTLKLRLRSGCLARHLQRKHPKKSL